MDADFSLKAHLRQLEELLTKPEIRKSPADLARLLADDFREFGGSGRIFDKQQIIAALQDQKQCELSLHDFRAVHLAPEVVLVTYRGTAQFAGSATAMYSLRSSIWRRQNGKWEVVFHQGTPTKAADTERM